MKVKGAEIRVNTPWVYRPMLDLVFLSLPGAFSVALISWCYQMGFVDFEHFNYLWPVPILLLDASHFWSTIFRTYLSRDGTKVYLKSMLWSPVICYFACAICFWIDPVIFWRLFGYFALYHLMRQQDGLLKVYTRNEAKNWSKKIDVFCIQAFVFLPILFWHFTPRKFFWFDESLLMVYYSPFLSKLVRYILFSILGFYILKTIVNFVKSRTLNLGAVSLVLSTFVTWYYGIIYYNNDTVFTITNIVAHGVPYLYMVFISTYNKSYKSNLKIVEKLYGAPIVVAVFFFVFTLVALSFFEEFLWDVFFWKNTRNLVVEIKPFILDKFWLTFLVPLLALPKMTHYLIDGFIWKGAIKPRGFRF